MLDINMKNPVEEMMPSAGPAIENAAVSDMAATAAPMPAMDGNAGISSEISEAAPLPEDLAVPTVEGQPLDASGSVQEAEADAEEEVSHPEEDLEAEQPDGNDRPDHAEKKGKPARKRSPKTDPADKNGAPSTAQELERMRQAENLERMKQQQKREEALAAKQQFYSGISALQEAQRRKRILRGAVGSIERQFIDAEGTKSIIVLNVMVHGRFKVMIPFDEFFRDNPIDMSTVDLQSEEGLKFYNRRQMQMAEKMYNAEVDFIVTDVLLNGPSEFAIVGSRKQALLFQEKRNYFAEDGGEPRVKVGDTVEAKIISVGFHNMFVNVSGVDATIPLRDVTYKYVTDLSMEYKVGDTISVDIMEIKHRKSDGHVVLALSGKSAELKSAKERQQFGLINPGTTTLGVITNVRESKTTPGKIIIHVFLPYFKMPGIVRSMDPKSLAVAPKAGDTLRLRVNALHESGLVLTSCHGFHNSSGILFRG